MEISTDSENREQLLDGGKKREIDLNSLPYNFKYCLKITLIVGLSTFNFGSCLSAAAQTFPALEVQYPKQFNPTLVASSSIAGCAIGAIAGGKLVLYGRRRMTFLFNFVALFGNIIQLFGTIPIICAGRFIYGLAAGVFLCSNPKIIEETLPTKAIERGCGISTNLFINFAVMSSLLLGLGMPEGQAELETTNWWRVIFAVPAALNVLTILLMVTMMPEDSLEYHVEKDEQEQAMALITKIYPAVDIQVHSQIYSQLRDRFKNQSAQGHVSLTQCIFDANYRAATFMGVFLVLALQLTGVNIFNIFAAKVFGDINAGTGTNLIPIQESYVMGVSDFVGACFGIVNIAMFKRKTVLVGGHAIMGICLLMTWFFKVWKLPSLSLVAVVLFQFTFNSTNGSVLFIYCAEVCQHAAMGFVMLMMMVSLFVVSVVALPIIEAVGISTVLITLGITQFLICGAFMAFLKETKGLSQEQKANLYRVTPTEAGISMTAVNK